MSDVCGYGVLSSSVSECTRGDLESSAVSSVSLLSTARRSPAHTPRVAVHQTFSSEMFMKCLVAQAGSGHGHLPAREVRADWLLLWLEPTAVTAKELTADWWSPKLM